MARWKSGSFRLVMMGLALGAVVLAGEPLPTDEADRAFREGRFTDAAGLYESVRTKEPKDFTASLRLGEIALLENRLAEAEGLLKAAADHSTDNRKAQELLALVYYRKDDFAQAAKLYQQLGRDAIAKKLASFESGSPYQIAGPDSTTVKFILTDPLPLLELRVNGSEPINVILDTGGAELILDPEFAEKVNAVRFGKDSGTFAGGKKADVEHAKVDSVTLGEMEIRNVLVQLLPTKAYSAAAQGKRVDGVLGTLLLGRFLFTIDYPQGQLVLRRLTPPNVNAVRTQAAESKAISVPIWLAGDHYLLAKGTVNSKASGLFFIDTGLAGGGFTCPESTVKEAGIELAGESVTGTGGGGPVKVTPFVAGELSLGDATRRNVFGFFGPFPPSLEYAHGFRIAGLVSHGFFRTFAVTIDLAGMQMYLQPKP